MTPQEIVAAQIERTAELQKLLQTLRADTESLKAMQALRGERAEALKAAIDRLERRKKETVARIDAEIAACRAELEGLERRPGLDLSRRAAKPPSLDRR